MYRNEKEEDMKVYVLTAVDSDGHDIHNISAYYDLEKAKAEMKRQYLDEVKTYIEDYEEEPTGELHEDELYAWLLYNYDEDSYNWEINEIEIEY